MGEGRGWQMEKMPEPGCCPSAKLQFSCRPWQVNDVTQVPDFPLAGAGWLMGWMVGKMPAPGSSLTANFLKILCQSWAHVQSYCNFWAMVCFQGCLPSLTRRPFCTKSKRVWETKGANRVKGERREGKVMAWVCAGERASLTLKERGEGGSRESDGMDQWGTWIVCVC